MQKVGMKYGVICGLVYIAFSLVSILMGSALQSSPMLGILISLAIVVATFFVIFYGVREYRDTVNSGTLAVGEAVKLGALIALIAGLLTAAFTLLYNYVIDPGYVDRMIAEMRDGFEKRGMTDAQIDTAMKWTSMMRNPLLTAAFSIVWYCLWGIVKGLISGAILKKEPQPIV